MSDDDSIISTQSESQQSQTPPKSFQWKQTYKRKLPSTFVSDPEPALNAKQYNVESPAQLKRRIAKLERQLVVAISGADECPRDLDEEVRALSSAGLQVCKRCGLSHRKAELARIGMTVYGDKPKERKDRWIRVGVKEYLDSLSRACSGSAIVDQIEDELGHVEIHRIGNPNSKRKRFRPVKKKPAMAAVRLRLEEMVRHLH